MKETEISNVQLTPEIRERLRGFLGFDTEATFPYVPKIFRYKDEKGNYIVPKNLWPIFELKPKDGVEINNLEDQIGHTEYNLSNPLERRYVSRAGLFRTETLRRGIRRWKNLRMEDLVGIVDFKPEYIGDGGLLTEDAVRVIPIKLQVDLQEAINERSTLNEDELMGLGY